MHGLVSNFLMLNLALLWTWCVNHSVVLGYLVTCHGFVKNNSWLTSQETIPTALCNTTMRLTDSFEKGRKEEIVLFFRLLFSAPANRQSSIRGNSPPPPPSSCPVADDRNTGGWAHWFFYCRSQCVINFCQINNILLHPKKDVEDISIH
jgi:hypothetical protein